MHGILCCQLEEFAGAQQEVRIGRLAKLLIPGSEGFKDKDTSGSKAAKDVGEKRTMQVIGHDDACESALFKRPYRAFGFEIYLDGGDTRTGC